MLLLRSLHYRWYCIQSLDVIQLPVILMVLSVLLLQLMHVALQLYLHLMVLFQVMVVTFTNKNIHCN